ncbi:MAG: HEAT repeat domain-containing protein, partial [Polyangiaceae bacterium]
MRDPGFTPKARDVGALVEMLADEELARPVERAIARVGPAALVTLKARLATASPPLRGRIVRTIGRFAAEDAAAELLIELVEDATADAKSRRNAVIALGRSRHPGVERALSKAWERDERPEMRRSIAESLGKVARLDSLALLREAARSDDPELARIADRAARMIERTASRGSGSGLDPGRSPARGADV